MILFMSEAFVFRFNVYAPIVPLCDIKHEGSMRHDFIVSAREKKYSIHRKTTVFCRVRYSISRWAKYGVCGGKVWHFTDEMGVF